MSNQANKLLDEINAEYKSRLANGEPKEKANVFANQLFLQKYHYDANILDTLLDELSDYGYIVKWIAPGFEFIVD